MTDLPKLLAGAKAKLASDPDATSWQTPDGVHYGTGAAGKLAVLFPGQGSQYVGMLRELACLFPELLDALAEADRAVAAQSPEASDSRRLSDRIYPPDTFEADRKAAQDRDLRDTRNAQPAIGAVSYGLWEVLRERFGLSAAAFAGHSYGELVALAAAGRLGSADLFAMSRLRGELMVRQREGDAGSMLAVLAPLADLEDVLRREGLKLVVANKNAPGQSVLSGATAEVERAERAFAAAGMNSARLPVAAAFHSEFVADAAGPFRAALGGIEFKPGTAPVFANTTASEYPAEADAARDLLANQLARPVAFVDQVRAMAAAGVRTFVEVGPGSVLARLAGATLAEAGYENAAAFALDPSGGKRSGVLDLGNGLARLAAGGVPLRVSAWEEGSRCRPAAPSAKPGLTVSLCGANYVSPRAKRPPRSVSRNGTYHPTVGKVPPMPDAQPPANPDAIAQALAMTQQSLAALQRMQEQTAQLHRQFLESQEAAQRTLHSLVEQQQALLLSGLGAGVSMPVLPPPVTAPPRSPLPPPVIQTPPVIPPAVPAPQPIAPAAQAPPTPLRVAANKPAADHVAATLLAVVAEKTGYPVASLDLGLALDADLGVDSIKRVEILSALQERLPDAPQVKPEHLGSLHTLQDVADFLARKPARSESAAPATTKIPFVPPVTPPDSKLAAAETVRDGARVTTPTTGPDELAPPDTEQIANIRPQTPSDSVYRPAAPGSSRGASPIIERPPPRGSTPPELPRPHTTTTADRIDRSTLQAADLDLNAPRPRLPLHAGGEVWVVADADPLAEPVAQQLARHGFSPRVVGWSAANHPTGPVVGLILIAPVAPGPDSGINRLAFEWLQQVGPRLRQAARQAASVFVTVARLDGAFGLSNLSPDADPTAGGLAGIVKTARHEWVELSCKAIDLDPTFADPAAAAAAIVDELLLAGPAEVGIAATHRCTLELARTVRRASSQTIGLGPKDVVLVTGGARGVTAEAAVALAEAYHPVMILTGRTPPPTPEPEWLTALTGEAEIKQAIAQKLGPDAGPRQIGEQYQKVVAQREVRSTLQRIEQVGAKVAYFPVDAANGKAVADLLQQVRVKFGPVTAVVHGAGVLADRRIEDLTTADFDRVYSTKVDGLRNLLDLLAQEELKALVLFSSTTARLGRTGQLAYAAANEVLNKTAQVEARRRPGCRVVAINWGPWEGGMVTPGLRKQFEGEGVGLIPLAEGALFMVQELTAAGKAVEVVALGKHRSPGSGAGVTPMPIAVPGSQSSTVPSASGVVSPPNPVPAIELAPAFDRTVDVESHPVLKSHVIDGRAVLPMVLHLELLAHAALHGHPGLVFHGFNDLRITQGVKLDAAESVTLRAFAGKAVKQDRQFVVPVELRGKRRDGREVVRSRAEIVLVAALPKAPPADRPPTIALFPLSVQTAYDEVLFHGPDLRGIERIDGVSDLAITGMANPAPPPADWFQYPLRSGWVADPLVLDASFQMMILWSHHQHQAGSLPSFAGRYRQFRRPFPDAPARVAIRVTRDNGQFARADIDYLDADGQVIAQMQDYECMMEKSLNAAFRRNQLGAVKA